MTFRWQTLRRKPQVSVVAMRPSVSGILETGIYVDDVGRSRAFYERMFGFEAMLVEDRICTFAVAPAQVLILFKRKGTLEPVPVGEQRHTVS